MSVRTVRAIPYARNVSLRRVANHLQFALQVMALVAKLGPFDVAVASLPPLSVAILLSGWFLRQGTRVIIDVQDLWPEALAATLGPLVGLLLLPARWLRDSTLRRVDLVTAVSQDYLDATGSSPNGLVCHLGVRLESVPHFDAASVSRPSPALRIAFVGGLRGSSDLWTVLKAARLAQDELLPMSFTIVGDGPDYQSLRHAADSMGLRNVLFTGYLPYDQTCRILQDSQICLNAIRTESRIAFPNRVFDYLVCGGYIINSIEGGELSRFLHANHAGIDYRAGDPNSLLEALKECLRTQWDWGDVKRRIGGLGEAFDRTREYSPLVRHLEELAFAQRTGSPKDRTHV